MSEFEMDFNYLNQVVTPDLDKIPLKGNEHRLVRVAFDLFRLKDEGEDLWQIQSSDDGEEFLARTYSLPEDEEKTAEADSEWSVVTDKKEANLTISYRNVPIHRVSASDFGASSSEEVMVLKDVLKEKLSSDKSFVGTMLATMPKSKQKALKETFSWDYKGHKENDEQAASDKKLSPAEKKKRMVPTGHTGTDPLEGLDLRKDIYSKPYEGKLPEPDFADTQYAARLEPELGYSDKSGEPNVEAVIEKVRKLSPTALDVLNKALDNLEKLDSEVETE